jgi:ATP-binding cassette subfamily F protein 3
VNPSLSAVDEVRRVRGDFTVEAARQYLARFRFWGDAPLRVVGGFSGGERARLALAKLLLEPRNLLFLDEPTNHLDIPAAEILEEALVGFEGTVILVSHDRRFLENVTTRIVSVRDGQADVYPGGFRDYVAAHARANQPHVEDEDRYARSSAAEEPPKPPTKRDDEDRKKAYEEQRQKARAFEKKKRRVDELEKSIASAEKELEGMREKLRAAPGDDWEKLAKMAHEEQALAKRLDAMLVEWAQLSEEVEAAS